MERVIGTLVAICCMVLIQSFPINNGFSVKFNPLNPKEDVKPKSFGALFAKIPQALSSEAKLRRQFISKAYYPNPPELGSGCSNQVAKVVYPLKNASSDDNYNELKGNENLSFINLPIVKQPFENYKILVAMAPPNVKITSEDHDPKSMVIYVVFPDDGSEELSPINIPAIYFVNQKNGKMDIHKKEKAEQILIVNSNRTVTGLKSKEIEKFVKFKNKLTNRYNYQISR